MVCELEAMFHKLHITDVPSLGYKSPYFREIQCDFQTLRNYTRAREDC